MNAKATQVQGLRAKDVCKKLGIAKSTLYFLVQKGKLPPARKLSKISIWIESEIDQALGEGAK